MKRTTKKKIPIRKCVVRHCVTEEICEAFTDGKKYFDEKGNELDCNFSEIPEAPKWLLKVFGLLAFLALIYFLAKTL